MRNLIERTKNFIATRRGKAITGTIAAVLVVGVLAAVITTVNRPTADAVAPSDAPSNESNESNSVPFASAPAVSGSSSSSSSSGLSVSVNTKSSSSSKAASSAAVPSSKPSAQTSSKPSSSLSSKASSSSHVIVGQPHVVSSSVPQAAPPKTSSQSVPTTSYAGYTRLDMTDFQTGTAIYEDDPVVAARFDTEIGKSSNIPRDKMGTPVVTLSSTAILYERGEVSLAQLSSVLVNGHKYIGGGSEKYTVTGVYDNHSGITYDRTKESTAITQVYAKGFVNNPYSGTTSYSDGSLCVKVADGGSVAKTGYVRAVVFTLKKIL